MSTFDQDTENQLPALERMAAARGYGVTRVYRETASTRRAQPALAELLEDARTGAFSVAMIWAIDRLGRSMVGNLNTVAALERYGVHVISHSEPWMDTTGPLRDLLLGIFSWFAEQERKRLGERVAAGMAKIAATGKHVGRPRARFDERAAVALIGEGASIRDAARRLGIPLTTLHRVMRSKRATLKTHP